MPIYGFECTACGHNFDRLQKMSDPDPETCPECGAALKRQLTAPSFRLAGSGWYETDFKKDSDKKRNLVDAGGEGKGGAGGSDAPSKEPAKDAKPSTGDAAKHGDKAATPAAAVPSKTVAPPKAPASKSDSKPSPKD